MKFKTILPILLSSLPLLSFSHDNEPVTIYHIEQSPDTPNQLQGHVNHLQPRATELILTGAFNNIMNQVSDITCDGKQLKASKPGVWAVAENCRHIEWTINLLINSHEPAAKQVSLKTDQFILFSSASSLPRLADATGEEKLQFNLPDLQSMYPSGESNRAITLPPLSGMPIFVLLNPAEVSTLQTDNLKLTYLMDNAASTSALPSASDHMKGLNWLNSISHNQEPLNFTVAWLGLSKRDANLGGAAGANMLLANYPNDGEFDVGKPMLLYVVMHEAFHQFAKSHQDLPFWLAESLASYYGARALIIAEPDDPKSIDVMRRFQMEGKQVKTGLLAVQQHVKNGDRSEYGAFYTKGLAFWSAVDDRLRKQNDTLDNHLVDVMQLSYNANGDAPGLRLALGMNTNDWKQLRKRYLD
jgi:hypothetical protein